MISYTPKHRDGMPIVVFPIEEVTCFTVHLEQVKPA